MAASLHSTPTDEFTGRCCPSCDAEYPPDGGGIRGVAVVFEPLTDRTGRKDAWSPGQSPGIGGVEGRGELLEKLVVAAQQVGGAGEQHGDVTFSDAVEQRQQLVANPVPTESWIVVGWIVGGAETELRTQ